VAPGRPGSGKAGLKSKGMAMGRINSHIVKQHSTILKLESQKSQNTVQFKKEKSIVESEYIEKMTPALSKTLIQTTQ
jgi:hypothetical protein